MTKENSRLAYTIGGSLHCNKFWFRILIIDYCTVRRLSVRRTELDCGVVLDDQLVDATSEFFRIDFGVGVGASLLGAPREKVLPLVEPRNSVDPRHEGLELWVIDAELLSPFPTDTHGLAVFPDDRPNASPEEHVVRARSVDHDRDTTTIEDDLLVGLTLGVKPSAPSFELVEKKLLDLLENQQIPPDVVPEAMLPLANGRQDATLVDHLSNVGREIGGETIDGGSVRVARIDVGDERRQGFLILGSGETFDDLRKGRVNGFSIPGPNALETPATSFDVDCDIALIEAIERIVGVHEEDLDLHPLEAYQLRDCETQIRIRIWTGVSDETIHARVSTIG